MPTISCKHCGKDIEVVAEMSQCPHCQKDIRGAIDATIVLDDVVPRVDDIENTADTAKTAIVSTAQQPELPLEVLMGVESGQQTLDSAGRSPNLADYSATLKPTDSAFESVDLSSAIPPRTISTSEQPGEAQDYRLQEKIGSGSFGVVYRAEQVPLERTVALKMLKPRKRPGDKESKATKARLKSQRVKDRNEFLREAQFTGKLEHPNIVPVHDIGLIKGKNGTGNRPFYVMKEIKGDSWQSKLKNNTQTENLEILKRVADAIDFAHDKNIIHCDLKPENVMLGEFGEVLVVDWGGAVDLSRQETFRPGGSPAYISPEMATYWCDTFLDHKEDSNASREIGKQSDVYLLGAMLFEIITGNPPHFGLKGEDAYDVMRRATDNQIRRHDEWMDDELMQIARRAVRLDEHGSYETVHEFQEALRAYEERRISIELRDRAEELLASAKEKNDYDAFGKARFGFEESIEKWEDNTQSKTGLLDARLSCADLAFKDQNFDLGIGMLENPDTAEEKTLRKKLVDGKKKRDQRKRLVQLLSVGLILGGVLSVFLMFQAAAAQASANTAKSEAIVAKSEADTAKKTAEQAQEGAKVARGIADVAKKEAAAAEKKKEAALAEQLRLGKVNQLLAKDVQKSQNDLATKQQEVQVQQNLANTQKKIAEEQKKLATNAKREAIQAEERNRLLKYKDKIGQIRSNIVNGNYAMAKRLLGGSDPQAKSSWEWARLNMLAHPEAIQFLPEEQTIVHASASEDGSRIVIVKDDIVVVHDATAFDNVEGVRVVGASVAALTPDGRTLAIGIPGQNGGHGRIEIHEGPKTIVIDEAPSKTMTDLQFSSDGQQLLCVGTPDGARWGARIEKGLMVYRRGDQLWKRTDGVGNSRPNTIDVNLSIRDGAQTGTLPKFTDAAFSKDGLRILLSNRNPTNLSRFANVLEYQPGLENEQGGYRWIAETPFSNVDAAVFINDNGTRVAGCHTEIENSDLFVWNVPEDSISSSSDSGVQVIAQLEGRVRSLKRSGNYLLTGGDDKKTSLWDLTKLKLVDQFAGHSRGVDFCTMIPGDNPSTPILISISIGTNPEIVKTNLANYVDDIEEVVADTTGENAPDNIFRSSDATRSAVGNDKGLAVVQMNGAAVEWEVSAWQRHVLTKDYLFAQTRRDDFLRYDRKSGAIVSVLTKLSQVDNSEHPSRIIKFQVSDDGRVGLVESNSIKTDDDEAREFQVWDLVNQTIIKRLYYGNLLNRNRNSSDLPTVKLSPDGKFVVAGKVGFVVWSTEAEGDQPIYAKLGADRGVQWPNNPINNIIFLDGGNEFAVSWPESASNEETVEQANLRRTGRLHLYRVQDRGVELVGRFRPRIIQGAFDTNLRAYEPNTLDAKIIDGQRFILVRAPNQIDLLALKPGQADPGFASREWDAYENVASFKGAKFARFNDRSSHVLILNKGSENPVQKWSLETNQLQTIDVVNKLMKEFVEFPVANLETVSESEDGSITLQSSVENKRNVVQRIYNTVTLDSDLTVGALRVLAKPKVEYTALVGDQAITLAGGTIRTWDLVPNQAADRPANWLVRPDGVLPGFIEFCRLSPNEKQLLTKERGPNGRLQVVDPTTGTLLYDLDATFAGQATAVAWSHDSNQIAIGLNSGAIRILNAGENGAPIGESPISGGAEVLDIAFSEDGSALLAIFGAGEQARVYRKNQDGWASVVLGYTDSQKQIVSGDISADGNRVVTGSSSGQLTIWNSESANNIPDAEDMSDSQQIEQRELFELKGRHNSPIRFVRFFKNGDNGDRIDIVSAEAKGNLVIWKTSGLGAVTR